MNLRQRPLPTRGRVPNAPPPPIPINPYNIIPIHDFLVDHPALRYLEVRAAAAALRSVDDLRKPPFVAWNENMDLMDWLGLFFGFQNDSVRNQREHLVLHLANSQMRLQPPPSSLDRLDAGVLRRFRVKLLKNYSSWCSYLGKKSQVRLSFRHSPDVQRRELLYACLYLLVWGEAANLRFTPECLCYIYHHMALELNYILDDHIDENTGQRFVPHTCKQFGFLDYVITPIYTMIKAEVERSRNGTAPHSAWRNYDDVNEYFWSRKCFKRVKWPINLSCGFLSVSGQSRVGKTGFVEQRTFWNVFRSFDRLWVMLILYFQAASIVAWAGQDTPWQALGITDVQVKLLTVFITWSGLRFLQSILDAGTQYSLVRKDTKLLGIRMVLKSLVALTWGVVFGVFYAMIWSQKNADRFWSYEANQRIYVFLKAALVFTIPELLAIALFILPWLRNVIEVADWRIIYVFTWWFQTRAFVGRGVREGLVDNIKYSVFWVTVLASKFAFSYYFQIRPLLGPTRSLLNLRGVEYRWHEFFTSTNRAAVVMLWAPVILIYLVDLQIWYTVFSSLTGSLIGLFSHIGEIRNIGQLRLRFQFFSGALQFNLMPEDQSPTSKGTALHKVRDALNRIKLRYGLSQYKKMESSQVEATRFALIWNEIIITMREEDLISDRELELLELPPNCWDIKVIRWPCVLLCNELLLALSQATEFADTHDRWVWSRICKNEYRRCAVTEAYDSIKYMLLEILKYDTDEHSIAVEFFKQVDDYVMFEKFTGAYDASVLPKMHQQLISLIELLLKPTQDIGKVVAVLQALYELAVRELPRVKKSVNQLRQEGLAPPPQSNVNEVESFLFEDAVQLPPVEDAFFYRQVRRLHTILSSRDSMHDVPRNLEARRRFAFFSNSLFMNMPRAPRVEKMMAFSVLTPYYDEEVMFGKENLRSPNEDGISTLFYLQKIYEDEWENFMERMRRDGMKDDNEIWSSNSRARDLRLWASYRGQTLSRTVRGMMYYYRALKMLSFLDAASEMDMRQRSHEVGSMRERSRANGQGSGIPVTHNLTRAGSSVSLLFKGDEFGAALLKFTYVVACQMYGVHKAKGDPRAEEIFNLMRNNEALRVAYVDEVKLGRDEVEHYSVLVKYDQHLKREVEVYRIKLPGPLKLGEGKPENQNHAIIFTRGDALQTIDMNQDSYFEEALKMRNLLEEFKMSYGIRKPTILGIRENIFTGSVSSLARFMSAQEMSFVTLGQRVLANPLKVRMHYGHPDVFDRFWFLPRGGVSKASRVINISEDIYAGFNCTLRGGNVTHHEYIQVGKGRDVGLNQISMFEAKVSSGNGEQSLSRDMYRLGHRLDFFRMLSVFYTTVGYYFNTMMVIVMVYAFLWGRLYLALSGVEEHVRKANNNRALASAINQQFVIQIGVFTALPMIVENSLERGFLPAIWDFFTMQFQLASCFYTFSLGTRAHYFGRTVLHGGAKYRATGRGFVVQHKSFAENYRLYSRSHFVKGTELGVILLVYASNSFLITNTFVYIAMTISSWFLVFSWIMSPFIFNPSGFDWLKTVYDFDDFINWLWYRGILVKADQSWETWWYEEQDHLRTTGLWGKLLEIILDLRFFFFQYGIVYHLKIAGNHRSIAVYLLSWIYLVVAMAIYIVIAYARDKYAAREHIYYRLVQFLVTVFTVLVIVLLLHFTDVDFVDFLKSLLAFVPTGWGMIQIAQVLRPFLQSSVVWETVVSLARLYDLVFGLIVMAPLAFLSWMPGFQEMQTRILFNEAFSRGLQISRILTGKKSNVDV